MKLIVFEVEKMVDELRDMLAWLDEHGLLEEYAERTEGLRSMMKTILTTAKDKSLSIVVGALPGESAQDVLHQVSMPLSIIQGFLMAMQNEMNANPLDADGTLDFDPTLN